MSRLCSYTLEPQKDLSGFGCDWLPTRTDDKNFLTNKHTDYQNEPQKHPIGNRPLISDRQTIKISAIPQKISLKRHKSSVSIFGGDQNNFSDAKNQCRTQQIMHNPSEANCHQASHQNLDMKKSQISKNVAVYHRSKNEDKGYIYRSVIALQTKTSLPQRLLFRQNSGNDAMPGPAIFVPHLTHASTMNNQQHFRPIKQLHSFNEHSDIFPLSNQQQKAESFLLKPTKASFDENLLLSPQKKFKKHMHKESLNSCIKSKLSLQTNIDREPLRQDYSQSSQGKPRTMNNLTRMADVEEIISVLDDSDLDDKQSIVLGRMIRYSSGGNLLQQLQTSQHAANATQISFMA